jgi:hypothetical protein
MSPKDITTKSAANTNTSKPAAEPKATVEAKPVADPKAAASADQAPQEPAADESAKKVAGKKPLTIMVPNRLWKQLRLLASVEGTTLSAIFLGAVEKDISVRLKNALANISDDTEA